MEALSAGWLARLSKKTEYRMSQKKVITYGNPVLRRKAEEIKEVTDDVRAVIAQMEEALAEENGIGLAAPQIGVSKRIILVDLTKSKQNKRVVLINPVIIHKSLDTDEAEEGCLSVPGVWGTVVRPAHVRLKGRLLSGKVMVIDAHELFARALQHEMDHLDGKLFIDHLSTADREANRDKIEAIVEKNRQELGTVQL